MRTFSYVFTNTCGGSSVVVTYDETEQNQFIKVQAEDDMTVLADENGTTLTPAQRQEVLDEVLFRLLEEQTK